jgi:hypothetical protein
MDLYDYENSAKGLAKKEYTKGLNIAHQYLIKEIYWKQDSQSSTSNVGRRIFDDLLKRKAQIAYLHSSGKNQSSKDTLAEKFNKSMNEGQFAKLNKACQNCDDHKIKMLMEKLNLHHDADNIWAYFQTFRIEKKKILSWDDKKDMTNHAEKFMKTGRG